jgi:hypothetical protein
MERWNDEALSCEHKGLLVFGLANVDTTKQPRTGVISSFQKTFIQFA